MRRAPGSAVHRIPQSFAFLLGLLWPYRDGHCALAGLPIHVHSCCFGRKLLESPGRTRAATVEPPGASDNVVRHLAFGYVGQGSVFLTPFLSLLNTAGLSYPFSTGAAPASSRARVSSLDPWSTLRNGDIVSQSTG